MEVSVLAKISFADVGFVVQISTEPSFCSNWDFPGIGVILTGLLNLDNQVTSLQKNVDLVN